MSTITTVSVLCAALALTPADTARFEIPKRDVLIDEPISDRAVRIGSEGNRDDSRARRRAGRMDLQRDIRRRRQWPCRSHADGANPSFVQGSRCDGAVLVDGARMAVSAHEVVAEDDDEEAGTPESWTLTAEVGNHTVAQTTVRRRATAEGVRVTPIRGNGLVGTFS